MIFPDDGDAVPFWYSISTDSLAAKRSIWMVPENLALFDYLLIGEHLDQIRSLFDLRESVFLYRTSQLLHLLDLADDSDRFARYCSHEMRKKTCLVIALLPNPKVLILDAIFEGLDPIMTKTAKKSLQASSHERDNKFLTTNVLTAATDLVKQ